MTEGLAVNSMLTAALNLLQENHSLHKAINRYMDEELGMSDTSAATNHLASSLRETRFNEDDVEELITEIKDLIVITTVEDCTNELYRRTPHALFLTH